MDKTTILLKIKQLGEVNVTISVFRFESNNPSVDLAYRENTSQRDPQMIAIESLSRYEQILNDPKFPSVWPEIRANGYVFSLAP